LADCVENAAQVYSAKLKKGRQILAILLLKRFKCGVFDTQVELICANSYRNSIRAKFGLLEFVVHTALAAVIGIVMPVAGFQIGALPSPPTRRNLK
jgi:hypothetical protein